MKKNNFRFISIAFTSLFCVFVLIESLAADTKMERKYSPFIGIWTVKHNFTNIFAEQKEKHIWIFSIKRGKFNIEIPSLGYEFKKITVIDDTISAAIRKDPDNDDSKITAKIDIEIVEGLLDGKLKRKDGLADHTVTGRFEKLYKRAQKAEKIYKERFEDEKRRLWDRVRELIERDNTTQKPCQGKYKPTWNDCSGKRTFANGELYSGEFKNGKKHGLGTLTYADGEIYKGRFKNGMYHGEGNLTSHDGKVLEGIWVNDKFTSKR